MGSAVHLPKPVSGMRPGTGGRSCRIFVDSRSATRRRAASYRITSNELLTQRVMLSRSLREAAMRSAAATRRPAGALVRCQNPAATSRAAPGRPFDNSELDSARRLSSDGSISRARSSSYASADGQLAIPWATVGSRFGSPRSGFGQPTHRQRADRPFRSSGSGRSTSSHSRRSSSMVVCRRRARSEERERSRLRRPGRSLAA
jgi:hypothetical protein